MGPMENSEILDILNILQVGMIDLIEPGKTAYDENDVHTCISLINEHVKDVNHAASKEEAMKIVEKTVLALNDLNKKCAHELIDTAAREDIVEVIILVMNFKGFNTKGEDVTEEWREW